MTKVDARIGQRGNAADSNTLPPLKFVKNNEREGKEKGGQ